MFSPATVANLAAAVDAIAETGDTRPWDGAWLQDFSLTKKPSLVTRHQLHRRSPLWDEAANAPLMRHAVQEILETPDVTVREVTMVVKPPETGQPFPVHQDAAYYGHKEAPSVLAVVHLDDTCHENGALRFLPWMHVGGLQPHSSSRGKPRMDRQQYPIENTIEVSAKAGDVVFFSLYTPHASYPNRSDQPRRTVRIWYQAV